MRVKLPQSESPNARIERAFTQINANAQVPSGGLAGEVLAKSSNKGFDLTWRRLRSGTASLTAGAATVSLSPAEEDTAYQVILTPRANETIWVSAKATGSFTISSSNGASTVSVDWVLLR